VLLSLMFINLLNEVNRYQWLLCSQSGELRIRNEPIGQRIVRNMSCIDAMCCIMVKDMSVVFIVLHEDM